MPLKTTQAEAPTLNMTPLIDIVFLLIIFFMVGTKFTEEERNIELKLPSVGQAGMTTVIPEKKVINVYRDGSVALDGQLTTLPELIESLQVAQQQSQLAGVMVRGDAEGTFQSVASVLAACRTAGIRDMAISVKVDGNVRRE